MEGVGSNPMVKRQVVSCERVGVGVDKEISGNDSSRSYRTLRGLRSGWNRDADGGLGDNDIGGNDRDRVIGIVIVIVVIFVIIVIVILSIAVVLVIIGDLTFR